jgi:predicted RNase H-like HicB family nuclease
MSDYEINIFYSEEDGGYIAEVPELQFCSAFGTTPQIALEEVIKAKHLWLEEAKSEGRSVPTPRLRKLARSREQTYIHP